MAKRDDSTKAKTTTPTKQRAKTQGTTGTTRTSAAAAASTASAANPTEQRVVEFAEQLGRIVGTVQAKANGWLDRDALSAQVSGIRDSAANLLEHLAGSQTDATAQPRTTGPATAAASNRQARSGGVVDAPGKRHRKPVPNPVGVKASDTRIAKMKHSNEVPRRTRG